MSRLCPQFGHWLDSVLAAIERFLRVPVTARSPDARLFGESSANDFAGAVDDQRRHCRKPRFGVRRSSTESITTTHERTRSREAQAARRRESAAGNQRVIWFQLVKLTVVFS